MELKEIKLRNGKVFRPTISYQNNRWVVEHRGLGLFSSSPSLDDALLAFSSSVQDTYFLFEGLEDLECSRIEKLIRDEYETYFEKI